MGNDPATPEYTNKVIPVDFVAKIRTEEVSVETGKRLKNGDGGDNSDGMSDDWKTSVDGQLTQLHGDVRKLLYGIIGACLLAAGAYVKVSEQITDLKVSQAEASSKLDAMGKQLDQIDGKLDRLIDGDTKAAQANK